MIVVFTAVWCGACKVIRGQALGHNKYQCDT
ncbi:MAG: hypothetical protein KDJ47_09040 [Hyphomicrobiaceae bacterium]|nr:hypothetical protein [Hyphomicrobiaceae bacterium]